MSIKIAAISDTHELHRNIEIPPADILVCCGDITHKGEAHVVLDFIAWLGQLDQVKHKIFIAGNHDFCLQNPNFKFTLPPSVHYLLDSGIELEGIKFWGTPWTPFFYDWAFNGLEKRPGFDYAYKGGPGKGNIQADPMHPYLYDVFNKIPLDTNVLVCHGPPMLGDIDKTMPYMGNPGEHVGSNELLKALPRLTALKYGFYGHIHEAVGSIEYKGALHCNVATLRRDYTTIRKVNTYEFTL